MLSVEHLRYAGDECLQLLLHLINKMISDVKCLSSSSLNTAIATPIHKGKDKPYNSHKSYRMVRVQPLISRIFDEHLRPDLIKLNKNIQNENQYGFTQGISYLMAALQRHEAKSFCIDNKKTFFCVTLDGEIAFDVVSRSILTRELYCTAKETGQFWLAEKFQYENTLTRIKYNNYISSTLEEHLGVKQGNSKSSDHYKIYNKSLLDSVDEANLGIQIGPVIASQNIC